MRRALLIAWREYMAYARTVGFWLSLLALPVFMVLGGAVPMLIERAAPARTAILIEAPGGEGLAAAVGEALEDARRQRLAETLAAVARTEGGEEGAARVRAAVETDGADAGVGTLQQVAPAAGARFSLPPEPIRWTAPPPELEGLAPDQAAHRLGPWLDGSRRLEDGRELDAAAILMRGADGPAAVVWSARASDRSVEGAVRAALMEANRREAMDAAGVPREVIQAVDRFRPSVSVYSHSSAAGGEVSLRDRLPGVIGFAAGFLLWSLVITGASILMNSVIEEKANRILEVLLSSASPGEILAGKVLGVAALTVTVLGVWGVLGGVSLAAALPGVAADVMAVLMRDGLIVYLLAFLAGGYVMYASIFAAIGAFCETPRDAQTMMGPVMMVLVAPLLALQMAVSNPDAAVIRVMSWIPLFSPFLMSARAPSGPPMVEVLGALAGMAVTVVAVVWLAGRAFRAGALSDVKLDWRALAARLRGG